MTGQKEQHDQSQRPEGPCPDLLNRPLGGFAFMGFWAGLVEVICCGKAMQSKDMFKCALPAGIATKIGIWNWLCVSAGCSLLHMLFAPYVHLQLWRNMIGESKEVDDPSKGISARTKEARMEHGAIRASRHDVFEAFKETFRGDFIIYLYILVLVADAVWSIVGLVFIHRGGEGCNPRNWTLRAAYCGLFFVFFVVSYSTAWYFYMHAMEEDDTMTLRSTDKDYHPPEQAAQIKQDAEKGEEAKPASFWGRMTGQPATEQAQPLNNQTNQTNETNHKPEPPKKKRSVVWALPKLGVCMALDACGDATYAAPGVGELGDVVFAPASAVMLKMLFSRNGVASIGFAEEILPYTDIMPSACLAWFLENVVPNSTLTRLMGLKRE